LLIVHRFISAQRGLCLSLQFSILKSAVRRRVALEGHRFTPSEALKAGMVDRLANLSGTSVGNGTDKVLKEAIKLAKEVKGLASQNVWGVIKVRNE
jgi:enoyl-CoA hydratase/carnithine racemase